MYAASTGMTRHHKAEGFLDRSQPPERWATHVGINGQVSVTKSDRQGRYVKETGQVLPPVIRLLMIILMTIFVELFTEEF